MLRSFTFRDAQSDPVLRDCAIGQEVVIKATVERIEGDLVEVTSLGDCEPRYVVGERRVEFVVRAVE